MDDISQFQAKFYSIVVLSACANGIICHLSLWQSYCEMDFQFPMANSPSPSRDQLSIIKFML